MLKRHPFNRAESLALYNKCKDLIEVKGCYTNIFFSKPYAPPEYKVVYGYIELIPGQNLMTRHCFFVNEKDEAVDPTMFAQAVVVEDRAYYSFLIFEDGMDYINAIVGNDNTPDLILHTRKIEADIKENEFPKRSWILLGRAEVLPDYRTQFQYT